MAQGNTSCDIGDSPNSVATGRKTVPTVPLVWASTHHYTSTVPFQMTTTAVGPVARGKAGLDFGVGLLHLKTEDEEDVFPVCLTAAFENKKDRHPV